MVDREQARVVISKKLLWIKRRYLISKMVWVGLNLVQILLATAITLLSAYAIAKNTQAQSIVIFVVISFISAITAFIVNLLGIFSISERCKIVRDRIKLLEESKKKISTMSEREFQDFLIDLSNADLF